MTFFYPNALYALILAALLAAEGVFLNQRGCVDLARDQWDC